MRPTTAAAAIATALIGIAGCSSSSHHDGTHYTSAQAIADKLGTAGFTVSMIHKSDTAISENGGQSYDFTVTQKPGPAPGDSGINLFPNHKALVAWTATSRALGGVAVTGDTWAVSLASDGPARASSVAMAPRIAETLGGTVQK